MEYLSIFHPLGKFFETWWVRRPLAFKNNLVINRMTLRQLLLKVIDANLALKHFVVLLLHLFLTLLL